MANRRCADGDLIGLDTREARFVVEYVKDLNARRAAKASGHGPDAGYKLREKENISAAIFHILNQALESAKIDAEWLLMEVVDNHMLARQAGNLPASNTALNLIAKHTMVDAMASDKMNLNVHGDKDVMERLQRGRERARNKQATIDDPQLFIDPVSFF